MKRVLFILCCWCVALCLLCPACRKRPQPPQPAQSERAVNLVDRFKRVVTTRPAEPSDMKGGMLGPPRMIGHWTPPWRIEPVKDKFRVVLPAILPPMKTRITHDSQNSSAVDLTPRRINRKPLEPAYIGKLYDSVQPFSVTADHKHIAYLAKSGQREILVVNHREFPIVGEIGSDTVKLSKAGRVVYLVRAPNDRREWFSDGKLLADASFVNDYVFSPDGKRLAHTITTPEPIARLYMDNKLVTESKMTRFSRLRFSPDGKDLLYVQYHAGKYSAVIAGKTGPKFDSIKWNYPGWGQAFFFSPDARHVAYVGRRSGKDILVVDNKPGEPVTGTEIIGIKFSDDSKQFAAIANGGNLKWFVIWNGLSTTPRGMLGAGDIMFSPNGHRLLYTTRVKGGMMLIVNDTPSQIYETIIKDTGPLIRFRSPDKFDYLIKKGDKTLLVEEHLVPIN